MAQQVVDLDKEKLVYNKNAFESILLPYLQMKIFIISIAGAYRMGKSYVLNFFVMYLEWLEKASESRPSHWFDATSTLDKFEFKSGEQRHTVGIHIYGRPFILKDNKGDDVVVLLMDTQGIFDSKTSKRQTTNIFALSTLLSSIQVFNVSKNIQADTLEYLELFAEFAKLTLENKSNVKSFQTLLFLVRDWASPKNCPFGYGGGRKLLKNRFEDDSEISEEQKTTWKNLKRIFSSIECFLMAHPGEDVAEDNDSKTVGDLRDVFADGLKQLVSSVFDRQHLVPKMVNGIPISCKEFLEYVEKCVEILSGDEMPEAKSVYQITVELTMTNALNKAKDVFIGLFVLDPLPDGKRKLKEICETAMKEAVATFEGMVKFGNSKVFRKQLTEFMKEHYENAKNKVKEAAETKRQEKRKMEEQKKTEEAEQRRKAEQPRDAEKTTGSKSTTEMAFETAARAMEMIEKIAPTVGSVAEKMIEHRSSTSSSYNATTKESTSLSKEETTIQTSSEPEEIVTTQKNDATETV